MAANQPISATFEDRRQCRRNRSLLGARIVFRDGYCSMGCLVLDISDSGALLKPDDIFACPKTFTLTPRLAPTRKCESVWRKGDKLGVRFI
jgi:hypothetical protein